MRPWTVYTNRHWATFHHSTILATFCMGCPLVILILSFLHTLTQCALLLSLWQLMMVQFWMYSLQTFLTLHLMDSIESCLKRAFYDNIINFVFIGTLVLYGVFNCSFVVSLIVTWHVTLEPRSGFVQQLLALPPAHRFSILYTSV